MIASAIIAVFSLALAIYWFRYSCILMLRNCSEETAVGEAAEFHLTCAQVKELLRGNTRLEGLERALERDYRLVRYVMEHAAGLDLNSLEDRLLLVDYRLMQWYYRATRSLAPDRARHALGEMADVVSILSGRLDRRAGVHSAA